VSFKDYLNDYFERERASQDRYDDALERWDGGPLPVYPKLKRPVGSTEPFASTDVGNIWGVIPFHETTLVHLMPRQNQKEFDDVHSRFGFVLSDVDRLIQFSRDTHRTAFFIGDPRLYSGLEELRPLFESLSPPVIWSIPPSLLVDPHAARRFEIRFRTLAREGLIALITAFSRASGIEDPAYLRIRIDHYLGDYLAFRLCGYESLADYLDSEMVSNPVHALELFDTLGTAIASSYWNPFPSIPVLHAGTTAALIRAISGLPSSVRISQTSPTPVPYEIGAFLLRKKVLYPETMDGCLNIMQRYDSLGLSHARSALLYAVTKRDPDAIKNGAMRLGEVCDEVWAETDKVRRIDGLAAGLGTVAPSLVLGIVGGGLGGVAGLLGGLLTGLGIPIAEGYLSGKVGGFATALGRRVFAGQHLVELYEFKNR
jgi:hypothetical protein